MKKTWFWALAFLSFSPGAFANDVYGKLGGGLSVPTVTLDSNPQSGFGISTAVGYRFGSFFEPVGTMEYNRFDLKNPVGTGGNNTDMLSAALNGQFDLGISLPVNPYVFAGGGFDLLLGLGTSGYGSYNLEWDPAIQAGAGIEFLPAAEVGFFAEARYHLTFRTGGNFSFVPVQAGMRFLIY